VHISHVMKTEQYLQSPLQLEHACEMIIDSELFEFHSERMSDILVNDVQSVCAAHHILNTVQTDFVAEDGSTLATHYLSHSILLWPPSK
jgi:hypothetical protein